MKIICGIVIGIFVVVIAIGFVIWILVKKGVSLIATKHGSILLQTGDVMTGREGEDAGA